MQNVQWEINFSTTDIEEIVDRSAEFFKNELSNIPEEELEIFLIELKIVVLEMLTNVKSHGKAENLTVIYSIEDQTVNLEFNYEGEGFKLKSEHDDFLKNEILLPPFPEKFIGKKITIYKGIEEELQCHIESPHKLVFSITPKNVLQNTHEIHEHFGLQLIATVSESFEYHKTPDKKDVFYIRKKIKRV